MNNRDHILPLDGLRGMAALLVLIGHFNNKYTNFPGVDVAPSLGVVLFFVLSGFLMGHLYLPQEFNGKRVASYVVARFARIYPLFALVVVTAGLLGGPFAMKVSRIPEHLLLAGAGGTVWTISVEFQFYAWFVLLWLLTTMAPHFRHHLVFVITSILLLGTLFIWAPEGRIEFLRYAHVFMLGVTAAVAWRRYPEIVRALAPWLLPASLACFIGSYFVIPLLYDQELVYRDVVICVICALLVLSAASAPSTMVGRVLSTRAALWFGELSFGIYLLHRIIMFLFQKVGFLGLEGIPLVIVLYGLTFGAAAYANKKVEVPCRAAIRHWYERKTVRPKV